MIALTTLQLILVASYYQDSHAFTLGFTPNYIDPLQSSPTAYATLITEMLLLLCAALKLANVFLYRLVSAVLRGRLEIVRRGRERMLERRGGLEWWARAAVILGHVLDPSIGYELAYVGLAALSGLNPFLSVGLFVDLFSARYNLFYMVRKALTGPWRLLLVIVIIWLLLNYFYGWLYYGFYFN